MTPVDRQKEEAALAALGLVQDGMIVGLGTGSTAAFFVKALGQRVREGLKVTGVPTSVATGNLARSLNIPLAELGDCAPPDLVIDGADEVDGQFRLIKGGGAALLREKIVAASAAHMVVIADQAKEVPVLGRFPLPIEVVPFGHADTARRISRALAPQRLLLRQDGAGQPLMTDGGHVIYDAHFGEIGDADHVARVLESTPGVVDHGLFIGLAKTLIVGTGSGARIKTQPLPR